MANLAEVGGGDMEIADGEGEDNYLDDYDLDEDESEDEELMYGSDYLDSDEGVDSEEEEVEEEEEDDEEETGATW